MSYTLIKQVFDQSERAQGAIYIIKLFNVWCRSHWRCRRVLLKCISVPSLDITISLIYRLHRLARTAKNLRERGNK